MPSETISTTEYCLANPGEEYLVFQHEEGLFEVDLEPGDYHYEWWDPRALNGFRSGGC